MNHGDTGEELTTDDTDNTDGKCSAEFWRIGDGLAVDLGRDVTDLDPFLVSQRMASKV